MSAATASDRRPASAPPRHGVPSSSTLAWTAFFVSCGVLGFEIALLRVLLIASWYHFAFLVISVALLGFGASGTALSLLRSFLLPRVSRVLPILVVATAISMPLCQQVAQHVPVEMRFLPALLGRQIAAWVGYWAVLLVPFFLGAAAVGLALMAAGPRVPTVYAANLMGSAAGALLATLLMGEVAPAWLASILGGVTLIGWPIRLTDRVTGGMAAAAVAVTGLTLWLDPPHVRVDPYKYRSYVDRLVEGGQARRVARVHGHRAEVEVYAGNVFHELPFLGVGAAPPPMAAILLDAHWAGSLLRVQDRAGAAAVDRTLMSIPYAFVPRTPRVLLLGETGGADTWLALRQQASSVDVVQPHAGLVRLLRGPLRDLGGAVFDQPGVRWTAAEPRHFVEHRGRDGTASAGARTPGASRGTGAVEEDFDLIQLVGLQSWAVESGGVGGLRQDYLVTVEGMAACLRRLSAGGILSVCRAIQVPPRDNAKLLATFIQALRRTGSHDPGRHLVVVRDYLGVCTLVKAAPWLDAEIEHVRALCRERQLTPVYFPGIEAAELNRPDALPGPDGALGDWLHHVVARLLSDDSESFLAAWPFDVRPPTDDRPFFANFSKLGSIGPLREAFGDLWLTRTELALLFVLAAAAIIAVVGVTATLLPLAAGGALSARGLLAVTAAYFTCIGLGYLMLEITLLSRFTHLVGDPVAAGAVTIAGFLLFSGVGSLLAQRVAHPGMVRLLILAVVILAILEIALLEWLPGATGGLATFGRVGLALGILAPLGLLLGFPMPTALARLERHAPTLVPWAWGINGFASVLASPLATALGMMWGFHLAALVAALLYAVAALLVTRLPGRGSVPTVPRGPAPGG